MHEDADSTVDVEAPAHAVEDECFAATSFRVGAFYCQIDAVIQRLACRFVKHIGDLFGFLYKYKTMTEVDLKLSYDRFSAAYFEDVSFGFLYKYKTITEVDLKLFYDRFSAAYFEGVSNELSKEVLMLS